MNNNDVIFVMYFNLVTSCDDLSCGENEMCVEEGDSYKCVCHSDYEGENCDQKGRLLE
jgi:hypothetical protein